ncbi:MAG: YceI family protein [Acidimicrobiales bacterium]
MSRTRKIVIAAVALVVLGVGAAYGYIFFIHDDAPPALDEGDLDAALNGTTVPADTATTEAAASDTTAETATTAAGSTGSTGSTGSVDGTWNITDESTLGYRVSEVLGGVDTEAAGRTNQVTGTLTIEGTTATAAEFTVDMASVTSDESRRDGQFRDRIMSTDDFPTSTFVLTAPIEFGTIPADGETITATATGDLTLRGVTNSVTFDVTAQISGGKIGVLGSIPIAFSDYQIPDPSNGFAEVKDNGSLEFVLVFTKS